MSVRLEVLFTQQWTVVFSETFREAAPLHFLFKIESFSLLSKNSIVKCESNEFKTGGYKWKLSLYPDGNINENGNDHISLYLVLVDSSSGSTSLPNCWEMNVLFRLFLFDHIRDRYLIREDTEGRTRRFHEIKKESGFSQFVSLAKLKDPANGYLVDDTCVFGAEVFIAKPTRNINCITMFKEATTVNYTWKIENFSKLKEERLQSKKFTAGGHNWNVEIDPKGYSEAKDNSVSIFLNLADCEEDTALNVFTDYKLRVRDQINGKHIEISLDGHWFNASTNPWGWSRFIGLDVLNGQVNHKLIRELFPIKHELRTSSLKRKGIFHRPKTPPTKMTETFREAEPIHFLFKIESFSMLSKNSIVKYESNEFETGGYKWKLSLYPGGNKNENGNDHISLYLVLVDSSGGLTSSPACLELNVLFRLFLFDQIRDRYLIREDMEGRTRRFREMKKVSGFPQFVSLANFNDLANGYLVDDTCVFGAEVFIIKTHENIECLSMVKQPSVVNYKWKIENFSKIKVGCLESETFKAGDHNWRVQMFPKGNSEAKDNSVSLFLKLADCVANPALKVLSYYKFRVRDQINGKHIELSFGNHWFCASTGPWGWRKIIGLDVLNGQGNGYLVNDTCIVEAEVKFLGVVSKRP